MPAGQTLCHHGIRDSGTYQHHVLDCSSKQGPEQGPKLVISCRLHLQQRDNARCFTDQFQVAADPQSCISSLNDIQQGMGEMLAQST